MHSLWNGYRDGRSSYAVFGDFPKTSVRVPHVLFSRVLQGSGVVAQMLGILGSLIPGHFVKLKVGYVSFQPVSAGVPNDRHWSHSSRIHTSLTSVKLLSPA